MVADQFPDHRHTSPGRRQAGGRGWSGRKEDKQHG
jgi:hypothetical protein